MRFYTKLAPETAYRFLVQRSVMEALSDLCGETQTGYMHRNPVALAKEWQALLDSQQVPSRAALARQLDVSRSHVTQVLGLLRLSLEEQQRAMAFGDPIEGNGVGIHTLLRAVKCEGRV